MTYYKGEKKEAEAVAWGRRVKTKPSFWQKAKGYGKVVYSETKDVAGGFKKNIPQAYKRTKRDILPSIKFKKKKKGGFKFKHKRRMASPMEGLMGNFDMPRFDFGM